MLDVNRVVSSLSARLTAGYLSLEYFIRFLLPNMTSVIKLVIFLLLLSLSAAYHFPSAQGSYEFEATKAEDVPAAGYGDASREEWAAPGTKPILVESSGRSKALKTFCWPGLRRGIRRTWYTAYFLLNITDDSFHLYKASTTQEVQEQFKSSSRFFALLPWRERVIRLNGFSPTCLGVYTNKPYSVTLKLRYLDYMRLAMFVAGVTLVLFARKMSRNTAFHYSSGISIALVGSLLVLIVVVSRMIPRRAAGVSFLVGGWAVVLYFFQALWKNFRETVLQHKQYVTVYVAVVSMLTFLIIYRLGGVQNRRTMDILQWGLQVLGAALIYLSCTIGPVGISLVVLVIALDIFLHSGYNFRQFALMNKLFPPRPPKLLSQNEFEEVGRRETEKALQQLRQYCNSPECKQWSIVKKLNTPTRFSSFVEDGVHLTTDEVDAYERVSSFEAVDDMDDEDDDSEQVPVVMKTPRRFMNGHPNGFGSGQRNGSAGVRTTPRFSRGTYTSIRPTNGNRNGVEAMDY